MESGTKATETLARAMKASLAETEETFWILQQSQKESESEDVGEVQKLAGGRFQDLFKMEYF